MLLSLSSAVATLLTEQGTGILMEPQRFVGAVSDLIDTDTPQMTVLYNCCDAHYLSFFAEALEKHSADALATAAAKGADYLANTYAINTVVARETSRALSEGVGGYVGVQMPPDPQEAKSPEPVAQVRSAVSDVPPEADDPVSRDTLIRRAPQAGVGPASARPASASVGTPIPAYPAASPVQPNVQAPDVHKPSSAPRIVAAIVVVLAVAAVAFFFGRTMQEPPSASSSSSVNQTEAQSATPEESVDTESSAQKSVDTESSAQKSVDTVEEPVETISVDTGDDGFTETNGGNSQPTTWQVSPATQERYFVSATGSGVNVRTEPRHESGLVTTIDEGVTMYFHGLAGEGYGSDGLLHDWYYIEVPWASGWVRSDLVYEASGSRSNATAQAPEPPNPSYETLYSATGSGVNLRSESRHESGLVATADEGVPLKFYGEVGRGYGSDGLMHDWYHVEMGNGTWGWVRSDLVS